MFRAMLVLAVYMLATASFAQDNALPFRPIVGINLGVGLPKVETISGTRFSTRPFFAGTLDFGASWTYREKLGLAAHGILAINGYDFTNGEFDYDIYHLTRRAELRAFWQRPLDPASNTRLRIGLGVGLASQGNTTLDRQRGPFRASTSASAMQRTYLSPEVVIMKQEGRHRVEFGLRYVTHLQRQVAFATRLSVGADTTLATATHDHLALVIRFHWGLKRRALPMPPRPTIAYAERTTDTLATLHASKHRITLWLWDNAEYDGDTISVFVNDRPVLVDHELRHKRYRLKIDVAPGENTLLMVAHNEGRVPPNTASCSVRAGRGRQRLLFSTSLQKNQVLRIVRGRGGE